MGWGFSDSIKLGIYGEKYLDYLNKTGVSPNSTTVTIKRKTTGFMGITTSEDIYIVFMTASKIFNEDQYIPTRNRLIAEKCTNGLSTSDYIYRFADVGDRQFSKYYYYGKYFFLDYLPESRFFTTAIPFDELQSIIEQETNSNINIIENSYSYMIDDIWCRYTIQNLYNYDINTDALIKDNEYYYYDKEVYNSTSKTFTVYLNSIKSIFKNIREVTEIKVTSKDSTTDIVTTTVNKETSVSRGDTNAFLYEQVENISTSTEEVSKGTVLESTSYKFIETIKEDIPSKTITYTIDGYDKYQEYYLVKYMNINTSKIYYWIYNPSTNKYPQLASSSSESVGYDAYPIATIRTEYQGITGKRKESTDKLLGSIGLNSDMLLEAISKNQDSGKIKDVFFLFGITPADKDPVVSKVLYNMVEYVYKKLPSAGVTSYGMAFREQIYKSDFVWTALPPVYNDEKILDIGECKHTSKYNLITCSKYVKGNIVGNTLYIKCYDEQVDSNGVVVSRSEFKTVVPQILDRNRTPSCTYLVNYGSEYDTVCTGYNFIERKYGFNLSVVVGYEPVSPDENGNYPDDAILEYDGEGNIKSAYTIVTVSLFIAYDDVINDKEFFSDRYEYNKYVTTDLIITKQISRTQTKTYTLLNFSGSNFVPHKKGGSTIGMNSENKELVIPLSNDMMKNLSIIDKTKLLDNSVHLQIYAFDHKHLAWYQTGFFGAFLKALSVVITVIVSVISLGSLTAEAVTLTAALWALLEAVAIGVALSLAIKLISVVFKNSLFLRVALTIAAAAAAMYAGGVFDEFSWIDVVGLANSGVNAAEVYMNEITMDAMNNLKLEAQEFNEAYKNKLELFEDIFKSIDSGLSVTDVVDISINSNNTNTDNMLLKYPSTYYYLATEAYKDFDVLYSLPESSTSDFVESKLQISLGEQYE